MKVDEYAIQWQMCTDFLTKINKFHMRLVKNRYFNKYNRFFHTHVLYVFAYKYTLAWMFCNHSQTSLYGGFLDGDKTPTVNVF